MKTILMCKPTYFEVRYIINPWMTGNIGKVNHALATRQWETLHDTIAQQARIKLIAPQPGLPDMVFTANAGLVTQNREVIVSTFRHAQRQGESQYFKKFFEDAQYQMKTIAADTVFEGAGDALFDARGELWLGSGMRSDVEAAMEISSALRVKINALVLIDPRWYHLDTAFCPLSDGYVLAYQKAFSPDSAINIRHKLGDKVIWISDEDAMNFACNAVCLDHKVILYRASNELKKSLKRYNFNVIEIDVSEFLKSGGACKCMTLEI